MSERRAPAATDGLRLHGECLPRRAEVIWTPTQAVDEAAVLRVFTSGPNVRAPEPPRWCLFRRVFDVDGEPGDALLEITAQGRYQLFVNGERLGRGPVRCDPLFQRVDGIDASAALQPGRNVIAVVVRTFGTDLSDYQRSRGLDHAVFGEGGLYLSLRWSSGALKSDSRWRCLDTDAWRTDTPSPLAGLAPIESLDLRRLPAAWQQADFDDAEWPFARALVAGGGGAEGNRGGAWIRPFIELHRNLLPRQRENDALPDAALWWRALSSGATDEDFDVIYSADFEPLPEGAVEHTEACLATGEQSTRLRCDGGQAVAACFALADMLAGYPFAEIDATGGEIIDMAVSEWLPGEVDGADHIVPRDTPLGRERHCARFIARPGFQRLEWFDWTAVRSLQIAVRNAPGGMRIRRVGVRSTGYPVEPRGAFTCSDDALNRLWQLGRRTLSLCMHDGWIDCPGRERRQWLGDVAVTYPASQAAFGPGVQPLMRQFLIQAAESQRPDGLTQMFAPGDHRDGGILIPDFTLHWVRLISEYHRHTPDPALVQRLFPSVARALAWFERQRTGGALLADLPHWRFVDWAGVDRDGESAAMNALYVAALQAASTLATRIGFAAEAARYAAEATSLSAALAERHWDEARGVYVDRVDPQSGEQGMRVSQHANAALMLWRIAPSARWASMCDWITDSGRGVSTAAPPLIKTGNTLNEREGYVEASTFFSHFVHHALAEAGRLKAALDSVRRRYAPMLEAGVSTLWEHFDRSGSACHGFSAGPVDLLSRRVLGVSAESDGFDIVRLKPDLCDLDWAEGVFPTRHGDVRISLSRSGGGVDAEVVLPAGLRARVEAPPGLRSATSAVRLEPGAHQLRFARRDHD